MIVLLNIFANMIQIAVFCAAAIYYLYLAVNISEDSYSFKTKKEFLLALLPFGLMVRKMATIWKELK